MGRETLGDATRRLPICRLLVNSYDRTSAPPDDVGPQKGVYGLDRPLSDHNARKATSFQNMP
jgi:hypothetical protein